MSAEQINALELEPEQVLEQAAELGPFVARVCLVSGGRDSTVLAHRCRDAYDVLAFVDTGTALPGVAEHVRRVAELLEKPLRVLETPASEYDRLVCGSDRPRSNGAPDVGAGFPGPALHGTCYARLKERQIERLQRELKEGAPRAARVLMLTGVRRAESTRRRSRPAVSRKHGRVFANPIVDWPSSRVAAYMAEHELPVSDVAALLHRSGECNCGAFAAPGERELLAALFPEWFAARIAPLESRAAGLGLPAVWGARPDAPQRAAAGELCSSCDANQLELWNAAG